MVKKLSCLLLLCLALSVTASACDVCGCSLGANYFGILPQFNKNFIGLRFSQSKFYAHMHHEGSSLPDEYSNDTYTRAELWGRFYLSEKFQVMSFVPYHFNTMRGNEQNAEISGLGDIAVSGQVLLINTGEDITSKFRHTLRAGLGIKLPTGKYDERDAGILLNPNFQRGTGSLDFIMNGIYTARYGKVGVNTEVGYKINTRNKEEYKFGNQFNSGASLFYWHNFRKLKLSLLPNAGFYFEHAAKHQDDYVRKANTGGSATFFTYGLETYLGSWALGFNIKHPVHQSLNTEEGVKLESRDRFIIHLTFSF
jgi:hypothetical protein